MKKIFKEFREKQNPQTNKNPLEKKIQTPKTKLLH